MCDHNTKIIGMSENCSSIGFKLHLIEDLNSEIYADDLIPEMRAVTNKETKVIFREEGILFTIDHNKISQIIDSDFTFQTLNSVEEAYPSNEKKDNLRYLLL